MTRPLWQQLADARKLSGKTLDQLREGAAIDVTLCSLSRKLTGKQQLSTAEAEAIAQFLNCNLVWAPDVSA